MHEVVASGLEKKQLYFNPKRERIFGVSGACNIGGTRVSTTPITSRRRTQDSVGIKSPWREYSRLCC